MTGKELDALRITLGISIQGFAEMLGYKKAKLRQLVHQYVNTSIDDPDFAKRILQIVPHVTIERMQAISDELKKLQQFGEPLDALTKVLEHAERNARFEKRFGGQE